MPFLRVAIVRKASFRRGHWLGGLAVDHWAEWTGPRLNFPPKGKCLPTSARHATGFSTCVGSSSKHQHLAPDGRQLSPVARRARAGARWHPKQRQTCFISRKIVERDHFPVPTHPVNPDQRFWSGAGVLDIGPFATKGAPLGPSFRYPFLTLSKQFIHWKCLFSGQPS